MIVVDTGGILALIDLDDPHHTAVRTAYEQSPERWILPWAILPEVDHLVTRSLGRRVALAFRDDLARGRLQVEWGRPEDLARASELDTRYADLQLGLVDGVVMAVAERLDAEAIVTLDLRDFGAVELEGAPGLWPRDL